MKKLYTAAIFALLVTSAGAQKNYGDLYPKDSIFFEYNTIPYQIDNNQPGNIWQVGIPQKTFLYQGYSMPLAITTDTLQNYPVNNTSSFSFTIFDTSQFTSCFGATYFEFKQRFDTDTINDFGIVEYSFDNGLTWNPAKDTFDLWPWPRFHWMAYKSLNSGHNYPGTPTSTGRSDGWILSRFVWEWLLPVKGSEDHPDTIIVRFTFHSDGSPENREGWEIDDIVTGCMDVGSGVDEISIPAEIAPNPMADHSVLTTSAANSGASFVLYNSTGNLVYKDVLGKDGSLTLYRNDLPPGEYLWRIMKNNASAVGKLILQ